MLEGAMREQTACFTGHREIPSGKKLIIREQLQKVLIDLIHQDYCIFESGGALGFDTIAAQAVLELKKLFPQIQLSLVLPCTSQSDHWDKSDKDIYDSIKQQADKVTFTSQGYTRGCMFKRNRKLVDDSSICICYLTKQTGGTAYTVKYARKNGIKTINLAEQKNDK